MSKLYLYSIFHGNLNYSSIPSEMYGKIIDTYDKILLPTYDVFDEHRYFTPGQDIGRWNGRQ